MEGLNTEQSREEGRRRNALAERIVRTIPGLDLDVSYVHRDPSDRSKDVTDSYETIVRRLVGYLTVEQVAELQQGGIEV